MRWQAAHLSGVAPVSTTCGPPSAEAVPPPPPPRTANAMATPAITPTNRVVFLIYSPPSAWHFGREDHGHASLDIWSPCRKRLRMVRSQYFHIWTRLLALSAM